MKKSGKLTAHAKLSDSTGLAEMRKGSWSRFCHVALEYTADTEIVLHGAVDRQHATYSGLLSSASRAAIQAARASNRRSEARRRSS